MASTLDKAITERLELAVEIAQEAGDLTLRYFRRDDLQVERKADKSPGDHRRPRRRRTPARTHRASDFRTTRSSAKSSAQPTGHRATNGCSIPIDGTKSFIHGVPLYTTLVAVLHDDKPRVGVIHAPAAAETVYAQTGGGCWYVGQNGRAAAAGARFQSRATRRVAAC